MATMGTVKSRDDYIKKSTEGFVNNANTQIDGRKVSDDEYINNFNTTTDAATQATTDQYQGRIDKAPSKFQGQYDANAVAQAVQQRQLQESMANMGLTSSGLNATNQTALAVQRNNADASTRAQQQNYVTELESAIDAAVAAGEQAKANNANVTRKETADWATDLLTKAYEQGQAYGRADEQTDFNRVWNQYVLDTEKEMQEDSQAHSIELAGISHQNNLETLGVQQGYSKELADINYKNSLALQDDSQAWQADQNNKNRGASSSSGTGLQLSYDDIFKYMEQTGSDFNTSVSVLTGKGVPEGSANANSAKNVASILTSGVKDWDATILFKRPGTGGGLFGLGGTILSGTEGDGKNVYDSIVVNQLKRSQGWNGLSTEEQAGAIAQAIGKSVGITWESTSKGNEDKNAKRIESALKAAGYKPGTKEWEAMVDEATKAYKNVR